MEAANRLAESVSWGPYDAKELVASVAAAVTDLAEAHEMLRDALDAA